MRRVSNPVLIAIVLLVMVLGGLAFLSGCGGQDETSTEATTATTAGPPVEQAQPAPGVTAAEPQEQTSPYGPGSTYSQSVGTLVDGLQLKEIRWSDHNTYFRVVFEMATAGGQPVLQVPHAEASLSGDKQIKVVLGGIRSLGNSASVNQTNLAVGDSLVASITRLPEKDDQALVYGINLNKPATFALAGIGDPGRIVVDIMK